MHSFNTDFLRMGLPESPEKTEETKVLNLDKQQIDYFVCVCLLRVCVHVPACVSVCINLRSSSSGAIYLSVLSRDLSGSGAE